MTAIDWVKNLFGNKNSIELSVCIDNLTTEICYKELALNMVISLIANSLVNSEFKTYEKGTEVKKKLYYLFNVSPNINQNNYDFIHKLIDSLICKEEALVIQQNYEFFIADSFEPIKYAFYDYQFKSITIDELDLLETKFMNEVFYFRYRNKNIKKLIDGIYSDYANLMGLVKNGYKKQNGSKIIIDYETTSSMLKEKQETLQEIVNRTVKPFIEGDKTILALPKGLSLKEHLKEEPKTDSNDFNNLVKSVFEYVALAFNIPIDLLYGNKEGLKEQTKNFMTFCLDPIANMITSEINRKYYSSKQYLEGTRLKVDTSNVEHTNIFDVAGNLDKLFRIGFTHNYLRDKLKEEIVDEDWANEPHITKNYMRAEGGEEENEHL